MRKMEGAFLATFGRSRNPVPTIEPTCAKAWLRRIFVQIGLIQNVKLYDLRKLGGRAKNEILPFLRYKLK